MIRNFAKSIRIILALLLMAGVVFAFSSCRLAGGKGNDPGKENGGTEATELFEDQDEDLSEDQDGDQYEAYDGDQDYREGYDETDEYEYDEDSDGNSYEVSDGASDEDSYENSEENEEYIEEDSPDTGNSDGGISENGEYTTAEDVAEYIHLYHKLPPNYVTKDEAGKYGWSSNECPEDYGIMIGGMKFSNREKLLPKGKYRECDVDYDGNRRGRCRLVYTQDGTVYYTKDHYKSFTQLY